MDTILQKIAQKSAEEVADIERAGRARADEARRKEEANADAVCAQIAASAEEEARQIAKTAQLMASLEGRKTLLSARREMIDRAFEEALAELCARDPSQKRASAAKRIEKAGLTGEVTVRVSDKSVYTDEWVKSLRAPGAVFVPGDETVAGEGVRLVTERVEVDLTLTALLADVRERREADVAKALFG